MDTTSNPLFDSQDSEKPTTSIRGKLPSAALITLAVSVGATGMLLTTQEDQAIAAEPSGADYTMPTPDPAKYLPRKPLQIEDLKKTHQNLEVPRLLVEPSQIRGGHLPVNNFGNIPSKINSQQRNRPVAENEQQDAPIQDHLPVPPRLRFEPSKETNLEVKRTPEVITPLLPLPEIEPRQPENSPTKSFPNRVSVPDRHLVMHQVKYGDTLGQIAAIHQVPLASIASVNNISNPNQIEVNQLLIIPNSKISHTNGQTSKSTTISWKPTPLKAPITPRLQPTPQKQTPTNEFPPPSVIAVTDTTAQANNNPHVDKLKAEILKLQKDYQRQISRQGSSVTVEQLVASTPVAETSPNQDLATPSIIKAASKSDQPLRGKRLNISQLGNKADENPTILAQTSVNPYVQNLQTEGQKIQQQYQNQRNPLSTPINSQQPPDVTEESLIPPVLPPNNPKSLPEEKQPSLIPNVGSDPLNNTPESNEAIIGVAPGNIEDYNPSLTVPPGGTLIPPLQPPTTKPSTFDGYMWPAKGVFTSGYGWRRGRMHQGIDVANSIGTPVVSASSGQVIFAGWNTGGFGMLVQVRHDNGSTTFYAHNSRLMVHKGQRVVKGQQIAAMGSTGLSTGPHLHFELHPQGMGAANPIAFLPRER